VTKHHDRVTRVVRTPRSLSADERDALVTILSHADFVGRAALLEQVDRAEDPRLLRALPDRENERVHDLVDLQLMEELIKDYSRLKAACIESFDLRGTTPR
jgi:hypothetical protein